VITSEVATNALLYQNSKEWAEDALWRNQLPLNNINAC